MRPMGFLLCVADVIALPLFFPVLGGVGVVPPPGSAESEAGPGCLGAFDVFLFFFRGDTAKLSVLFFIVAPQATLKPYHLPVPISPLGEFLLPSKQVPPSAYFFFGAPWHYRESCCNSLMDHSIFALGLGLIFISIILQNILYFTLD